MDTMIMYKDNDAKIPTVTRWYADVNRFEYHCVSMLSTKFSRLAYFIIFLLLLVMSQHFIQIENFTFSSDPMFECLWFGRTQKSKYEFPLYPLSVENYGEPTRAVSLFQKPALNKFDVTQFVQIYSKQISKNLNNVRWILVSVQNLLER